MSNSLTVITEKLTSKEVTKQLATALDLSPQDEAGQREAFKYASSVVSEIAKTQGAEYGDLTKCSPDSICRAVVDAAQFKIQIDGRKFAHLESRWDKNLKCNVAQLQIDTNGFIAKIKEAHPDAEFIIQPVFKGDTVSIKTEGNVSTFSYEAASAFGKVADLEGIIVQISYTNGGRMTSSVDTISIEDLRMIASKGKGLAWKDFPLERMKTAALKRAAKWHFRQNALLQKVIDYDNQQFDLQQQAASPTRPTIIDNINKSKRPEPEEEKLEDIEGEAEVVEEVSDGVKAVAEDTSPQLGGDAPISPDYQALEDAGLAAAEEGVENYIEWRDGRSADEIEYIKKHDLNKKWSAIAKENDPA